MMINTKTSAVELNTDSYDSLEQSRAETAALRHELKMSEEIRASLLERLRAETAEVQNAL